MRRGISDSTSSCHAREMAQADEIKRRQYKDKAKRVCENRLPVSNQRQLAPTRSGILWKQPRLCGPIVPGINKLGDSERRKHGTTSTVAPRIRLDDEKDTDHKVI